MMTSCLSKSRPPHPKDGPWAWFLLLYCSLISILNSGVIFGYGVLLPVLMVVFNQSREKTALVGSLMLGLASFLCIITTKLCEKYTCRFVMIIGLVLITIGLVITSFSNSLSTLYFSYSILFGFGASCLLSSNLIMVRKYFQKRYSLAIGIRTAAGGVGILVFGPYARYLIDSYGWRNTFRVFAGTIALMFAFTFILDPNVEPCEETATRTEGFEVEEIFIERNEVKPRKIVFGFLDLSVWTFPEYAICVVAIFIGCWGHYTPMIHLIKYSEELGMSPTKSSTLLIFVGIATITSRLLSGRLCDVSFIKPRYIHQAGIILSGISTIVLTFATNYTHLVIFSVFYGIADGAFRTTLNILFMNTVDIPRRPSAFGQANMVTSLTTCTGPAIAGMMADKSGTYTSAFYMAGSTSIVAGAIFFLHLCFFKENTTKQEVVSCNITDHPVASNGPAPIKAEDASLNTMISMLDDIHKQRTPLNTRNAPSPNNGSDLGN